LTCFGFDGIPERKLPWQTIIAGMKLRKQSIIAEMELALWPISRAERGLQGKFISIQR
jgi:hypothetical protein